MSIRESFYQLLEACRSCMDHISQDGCWGVALRCIRESFFQLLEACRSCMDLFRKMDAGE